MDMFFISLKKSYKNTSLAKELQLSTSTPLNQQEKAWYQFVTTPSDLALILVLVCTAVVHLLTGDPECCRSDRIQTEGLCHEVEKQVRKRRQFEQHQRRRGEPRRSVS